MIPKALNEITEAEILALKEAGTEEGKGIEYKRELPGTRDEDKREFLADISSFANTEGAALALSGEVSLSIAPLKCPCRAPLAQICQRAPQLLRSLRFLQARRRPRGRWQAGRRATSPAAA